MGVALLLFAIGLVTMFTIGGLSGVTHAVAPSDTQQTDTYYIVAHFHYVLFGGSVFGLFAGLYYWFPKMSGRMHSELLAHLHFWGFFIGVNVIFFPQHFLGWNGMPRRYPDYAAAFEYWNNISSLGYIIMAGSMVFFFVNVAYALIAGKKVGANYWGDGATTLEWTVPSPPPFHTFEELPHISPTAHH